MPRLWPVTANDIYAVLGGNALLILGMWIRHGGLNLLATQAGIFTAAGEISALFGTYLVLIQLILMSRSPWLDQVFGKTASRMLTAGWASAPSGFWSATPSSLPSAMPWA